MNRFQKTIRPKNTVGKIISLMSLLTGGLLFALAGTEHLPIPALAQLAGLIFMTFSVYIAASFLLREFTYYVEPCDREVDSDDPKDRYDLIIKEFRSRREIKVCHVYMNQITSIRTVEAGNKKQVMEERKGSKRYTYNSEFSPARQIEICALIDDEQYSILIAYDEELLLVLESFFTQE